MLKRKGSGREVYSRKKRMKRKREKPSRSFQALFNLIPDPAAIIDAKGDILAVNDGAERLAGLKREELVGKNFLRIKMLTAESASIATKNLAKRMMGLPIPPYELEFCTGNGEKRWGEVNSTKTEYKGKPAALVVFRETTKHKRAEEELRKSEEKYKQASTFLNSILSHMSDYVWITDEDYTIRFLNETAKSQHGDAVGEKCYKVTRNLDSPCHHRGIPCEVHELLEKGRDHFEDTRLSPIIGRITHIRATPTTTPEGKRAIVMVSRDVTEEKQAKEKLQESEKRYRTLFEESRDAISITTREGKFIDINQAYADLFGYTKEELLKLNARDLYANPVDREKFQQEVERKGSAKDYEAKGRRIDGAVIDCLLTSTPLRGEDGSILGYRTIVRDITELKRMAETLRDSEQRYRTLFEEALNPILLVDKNGRYIDANKAALQFLECDLEELQSKVVWDWAPPALLEEQKKEHAPFLSGRTVETEYLVHGKTKTLLLNIVPFTVSGKEILYGIGQDITERKKIEKELWEEQEKLKEAQRLGRIGNWEYDIGSQRIAWSDEVFVLYERDPTLGPPTAEEEAKYYSAGQVKILRDYAARSIKNGEGFTYDLEANLPSGRKAFFTASMRPIKDETGRVIKLFGTVQDITERKRMEEAFRDSERRYRSMFEAMGSGVAVYEALDNGRDFIFKDFNRAAERIEQVKREDVVGKSVLKVFPGVKDLGLFDVFQRVWRTGKPEHHPAALYKDQRISGWRENYVYKLPSGEVVAIYEDVTEETRAKEQLEKAHSTLRATLESTADGILVVSSDEKITDFNQRFVEMFQPPEPILSSRDDRRLVSFITDQLKDPEGHVKRTRELFVQPDLERSDLLEFMDGRIIERYSRPQRIGDRTVGRVVSFHDITERKLMEEELRRYSQQLERLVEERTQALRASEEKYRLLINNMVEVVFTIDLDGNFTFVSPQIESMVGYSISQLLSMNMRQLIAPEYLPEILNRLRARIQGEKYPPAYAFEIIRADGERIPIEMLTTPVYDKKGTLIAIQGVARDITERKKMEKALHDSEERYRRLVDRTPDMIFVHSEGKFVYVNPEGAKLLGATGSEQIIGKPVMDIIHPDYREIVKERIRRAYEEGIEAPPMVQKYLRLDGEDVDVETIAVPITYQGKPAVQGVARDITERKKIEQMKDRFISAVTHELRTPLVSISGYTDLALSGNFGSLSGDVKSSLKVIRRNADRLVSLTDDLLDIRRIESGKLELNMVSMNLKEIIDHCVAEIKPFLKERQELTVQVPDVLPTIQVDRVRLSQVLMNLLSNAAKFTPEGGTIKLSVKGEQDMVKVQVSDTGIGINKEDLQRVFEPFATIQKPTYIKGTGLGLSVSKGLVEAHGGSIWAESEGEGKGATFTFTLPKRKQEETSQAA